MFLCAGKALRIFIYIHSENRFLSLSLFIRPIQSLPSMAFSHPFHINSMDAYIYIKNNAVLHLNEYRSKLGCYVYSSFLSCDEWREHGADQCQL